MIKNKQDYSLYVDELPTDLVIDVKESSFFRLNIAFLKEEYKKANIIVNVHKDASFVGAMADFSKENSSFNLIINLLDDGAKASWHLAVLPTSGKKNYETSCDHIARYTEAVMSDYGIAMGESKISFTGSSKVEKEAIKTNTRQEAKIIVFDKGADGLASPNLEINDNDVRASHAAVVGRLNEEHLFYLESRGLSEKEAKRLIALGYLKPVEDYFVDEEVISEIDKMIEGGV